MVKMGVFVLTKSAARRLEPFASLVRAMKFMIGSRGASGCAAVRSSFRTLRPPVEASGAIANKIELFPKLGSGWLPGCDISRTAKAFVTAVLAS